MVNNPDNLPILQRGEPILAQVASAIEDINSHEIKQLISNLKVTMQNAGGVGIAAPQVGVSLRVFLMASAPSERYPNAPLLPLTVVINPSIINKNSLQELDWEGCLSVKGKRAQVSRYTCIEVKFQDETGKKHHQTLNGFIARIFQHELDHLDGITFIERLNHEADVINEQQWLEQTQITEAR
ncbi:peptide deformylase [Cognaticolwellia mytili]|uniref:peptide deformylase n=1 Tax=Cognaticolwellia mytili TaxID=1888913 RepID=UPI000A16F7DA|nr:peptide deformylase [Cognaticolwellia mytili]